MEFLPRPPNDQPKNLYPCLAQITITPQSAEPRAQRRLSQGSIGSAGGDEDGNALRRVISGGAMKRRTSFGLVADRGNNDGAEVRRPVLGQGGGEGGKWWWRVQAGVTGTHLVLLPLTQPANSLLTQPPAPLSAAMPSHHTSSQTARTAIPGSDATPTPTSQQSTDTGLVSKVKNLLHISSNTKTNPNNPSTSTGASHTGETHQDPASGQTSATAVEGERILDQTAQGEQLPSPAANAMGATNLNANAESGWPGVIEGEKLASVIVDLQGVDKSKVLLGGGKKEGGYSVDVPITSYFAGMIHGMIDPIGSKTHHDVPKSGSIRFEFDKDWIGAKGEAELLHHYITQALTSLPAPATHERHVPQSTNFQLGSHHNAPTADGGVGATDTNRGAQRPAQM